MTEILLEVKDCRLGVRKNPDVTKEEIEKFLLNLIELQKHQEREE